MRYLKIVSYLYIIMATLFVYDGIVRIQEGRDYYISFAFAGVAIFMFFFRMNFAKRRQHDNKNK